MPVSVVRNSEVVCYSGAAIVLHIIEISVGTYRNVCYWEYPLLGVSTPKITSHTVSYIQISPGENFHQILLAARSHW